MFIPRQFTCRQSLSPGRRAESGVDGASPHLLIKMLFDGLVQSLNAARGSLQRGDIEEKGRQIGKAVRILDEGLMAALNPAQGGEVAANLGALYDYCLRRLTQANLRNDVAAVEEVVNLICPVAEGWGQSPRRRLGGSEPCPAC